MPKFSIEDLKNIKPEDIEVSDAGPNHPVLAMTQLVIAQTFLLEMMKDEGAEGRAAAAMGHVSKAVDLLNEYPITQSH
jgi:hypothetical protein